MYSCLLDKQTCRGIFPVDPAFDMFPIFLMWAKCWKLDKSGDWIIKWVAIAARTD